MMYPSTSYDSCITFMLLASFGSGTAAVSWMKQKLAEIQDIKYLFKMHRHITERLYTDSRSNDLTELCMI